MYMEGNRLDNQIGDGALNYYKVNNPNVSNNIVQMRSQQPPFRAGGNQVPFFLGVKGNCCITPQSPSEMGSLYQNTLNQALQSSGRI
jgi:hypothetical protein